MIITFKRTGRHRATRGTVYKYVHRQLISLWQDSVKAFIASAIHYVLVDTGMSRASFYPLAAEVRLGTILNQSLSGKGPKAPYVELIPVGIKGPTHDGYEAPYKMKSKTLGRELGEKAYKLTFGSDVRPMFKFEFEIVVWQHYIHEYGLDDSPNVMDSLGHGKDAFWAYFHNNFNNYVTNQDLAHWLLEGE